MRAVIDHTIGKSLSK